MTKRLQSSASVLRRFIFVGVAAAAIACFTASAGSAAGGTPRLNPGAYPTSSPPITVPPSTTSNSSSSGYLIKESNGVVTVTPFTGAAPALAAGEPECDLTMDAPDKTGSIVYEDADVDCSQDVVSVGGTDYLIRGVNSPTVIGDQFASGEDSAEWEVLGPCHSSTWTYWAEIPDLSFCTDEECFDSGPFVSPRKEISC